MKEKIIYLLLIILLVFVNLKIYNITKYTYPGSSKGQSLALRAIETPAKEWLNGRLGVFFRMSHFSMYGWLIFPLLFLFFKNGCSIPRWGQALLFTFMLSCAFIAYKLFFNHRYLLTVYPMLLGIILYLIRNLCIRSGSFIKKANFLILGILITLQFYFFNPNFIQKMFSIGNTYYIPKRIYDIIERLDTNSNPILIINDTGFYYYTNSKGYCFWRKSLPHENPGLRTEKGTDDIFSQRNIAFELNHDKIRSGIIQLMNKYKVKYMLVKHVYSYQIEALSMIKHDSELIAAQGDYALFRFKDTYETTQR